MARLTEDQWGDVKAAYEVRNLSNRELGAMFGVSETAIRKKADKDCWIKGASSHLIDMKLNVINEVADISSQSSQLSLQHVAAIDDEVSFKLNNDKDLQAIQAKVNLMVANIENPSQALALMTATVKHREARLGKSPDVAVQINTGNVVQALPDDPIAASNAYQRIMGGK